MVKVFLYESEASCYEALQQHLSLFKAPAILVPNNHFLQLLTYFHPEIKTKAILTPTTLLKFFGKNVIPQELSLWLSQNPFIDISTYDFTKKQIRYYDAVEQFYTTLWNCTPVSASQKKEIDGCVFFGNFHSKIKHQIQNILQNICSNFIAIERTFHPVDHSKIDKNHLSILSVRSTALENVWIQSKQQQLQDSFCIISQEAHLWELFSEPLTKKSLAWLDWQEQTTLGTFLIFLQSGTKKEEYLAWLEDIEEAYHLSLSENFEVIYDTLIASKKMWIQKFLYYALPKQTTLGHYLSLIQEPLKQLLNVNLEEALFLCPLEITKVQFFQFLRTTLFGKSLQLRRVITWEEACYFPVVDSFIPSCKKGDKHQEQQVICWVQEALKQNKNVTICCALRDTEGNQIQPLFDDQSSNCKSDYKQIIPMLKPKESLSIPLGKNHFSCKTWERFYLCPRLTWLQTCLKTQQFFLHSPLLKAKLIGEWVHENLKFKQKPEELGQWYEHIHSFSLSRKKQLGTKTFILHHWNQQALTISLSIARACKDFLDPEWELHSEYILPKASLYSGRIDLLAIHSISKEAIIIDFKTALNYSFTPTQIEHGHGLQLLLYGRMLQPFYTGITLMVIRRDGMKLSLPLAAINKDSNAIEAWVEQVQTVGVYENLPSESSETLPLAYMNSEIKNKGGFPYK